MVSSSASASMPKAQRLSWTGWCAVGALWVVGLLALLPDTSGDLSIPLTFFVLLLASIIVCWTPVYDKLREHPDVATFCVTAVMFIVYGVARRFDGGLSLTVHSGIFVGDEYAISPAAILVFIGAVLSAPIWIRQFRGWANAMIVALLALTVLGFGSFWFLSQYYTVGLTDILDPTPLLPLAMNLLEFFFLTLVCVAACAADNTRKVLFKSLPIMLILLWGRHAFIHIGGGE
ncbi:MAG: hypothetical protein ABI210_11630 [Abditibacteriaceae bacterium]